MAPPFYMLQGIMLQLKRGIRVVRRLPKLQHLDTRLLRGVIADFLKDLSHLAVYSQLQGLDDERFYGVVARCSRLFTEVGRAVSTLEAMAELQRVDLPRATKRLAETLAADPCLEELERLLAEVKNTMDTQGRRVASA